MTLLTPFALGAAGQVLPGKTLRHSLGAAFAPGAGVSAISGVLHGPTNTMGELSLAGSTLTVQPFKAVVQNTQDATAGQYLLTNDAAVGLAISAQDATQFRRSLIVVRVDDSQVAGVSSSPTTDRGVLEVIPGNLAASSGAAALPATPDNALLLGELLIPPTGQTTTLTPYNPRTMTRGGILPVFNDSSTVAGHGSAPGSYVGQPRRHPTRGLEFWDGGAWAEGDTGWVALTPTPPTTTGSDGAFYRVIGRVVYFQIHNVATGGYAANFPMTQFPVGARPTKTHWFAGRMIGGTVNGFGEVKIDVANGNLVHVPANAGASLCVLSGSFPIG